MAEVVILGAGIAGLSCARELHSQGISCLLLEAGDGVGGRARTDAVEGFLLDRGFQVLLTAYPEAQRMLDYSALRLGRFWPGALIWHGGKMHRFVDPWRRPLSVLDTMRAPVGSLADKMKVAALRRQVTLRLLDDVFSAPEKTSLQYLRDFGFSGEIIERFFRPFLGGIFLDPDLNTSSRMLEFVFRMFSTGDAALPAGGMGAIAEQLAAGLPEASLRLHARAVKITSGAVELASGEVVKAKAIVVATDERSASYLLPEMKTGENRRTTCFYYAVKRLPVNQPLLVLNGEGRGPINNLSVPSLVARSYAPANSHLVSVSVVGEAACQPNLERAVHNQLRAWFGEDVMNWRLLKTYDIGYALPVTPRGVTAHRTRMLRAGVFICGDHCENASINGAMLSGRSAAASVVASLA
jgi:phytoene dehydrogenase-like protein